MADGIKKSKRGRPPGSKNKAVTALMRLDKAATTAAVQVEDLISGQVVMGMVGLRPCDTRHSRHRGTAYGQMQKLTAGEFYVEPPFTSFDHFVGAQRKCRRGAQPPPPPPLSASHPPPP